MEYSTVAYSVLILIILFCLIFSSLPYFSTILFFTIIKFQIDSHRFCEKKDAKRKIIAIMILVYSYVDIHGFIRLIFSICASCHISLILDVFFFSQCYCFFAAPSSRYVNLIHMCYVYTIYIYMLCIYEHNRLRASIFLTRYT